MKHVARIGDVMCNSLSERRRSEKSLRRFDAVYFNIDIKLLTYLLHGAESFLRS